MNFPKLEHEICRICLEHKASYNWNDEIFEFSGVSYKDCYYKYTQIEETDADLYPENLCNKCAYEVKDAHTLFEKALKSFIILQNTVSAKGYESLTDPCIGLQQINYNPSTFDENNIIESLKSESIDIDEVICYSPISDDNILETGNTFNDGTKTSINHDNIAPNFRKLAEKQNLDTSDLKLLGYSLDKTNKNKRKIFGSLNTELELKLQLEICGKKILKATNKASAVKTCKSLPPKKLKRDQKTVLVPMETVLCDTSVQRTQSSCQSSSLKDSLDNTELQQLSSTKGFVKSEETYKPLNDPLNNIYSDESDGNSVKALCRKRVKSRKKEEKKLSDNSLPKEYDGDNYISCTTSSNKNSSTMKDSETFSVTSKTTETKSNFNLPEKKNLSERKPKNCFPKRLKHRKKEENKLSDNSLLKENDADHYIISETSVNTNSSASKDSETCNKSTESKTTFHLSENYLSERRPLKIDAKSKRPKVKVCQYCSLNVLGTNSLLAHEATHLEHRERKMICPTCGIKLYTKDSLTEHMKIHEKNRQKEHKCEFCEKAFFHKGALNVHKRIHLGLMVKCHLCPKEFYRQIDLDRHLPSHSETPLQVRGLVKKYTIQCQYCNKSIRTGLWKEHKAAHLEKPLVKCKICNKDYYFKKSCYNHLQRTHGMTKGKIVENIHYYDKGNRMSHLMMAQQECLKPLTE